jgi:DNA polymerase-1
MSTPTLELYVEAGRLRYRLRRGGKASQALLAFLTQHKVELTDLLRPTTPAPISACAGPVDCGQIGQNGHKRTPGRWSKRPERDSGHSVQSVHGPVRNGTELSSPFLGRARGQSASGAGAAGPEGVDPFAESPKVPTTLVSEGDTAPGLLAELRAALPPVMHRLIRDAAELAPVAQSLDDAGRVGLDCETTGLDPRRDQVRLLSLAVPTQDNSQFVWLVDCFAIDPAPLWEALSGCELVGHNLLFDLQFLMRLGFEPERVTDTFLLSQLLDGPRKGRGYHGLAGCIARELHVEMPKELQRSDWSGTLSAGQLDYAARDADVLLPLADALRRKIQAAGMDGAAATEMGALPAIAWMSRSGVPFDLGDWDALAAAATTQVAALGGRLDERAPQQPGSLLGKHGWNWSSPEQVLEVFRLLGSPLKNTDDDALAGCGHPLATVLREHRTASKLASTYGPKWYAEALHDGRLSTNWKQIGCITGRMASASPNLQNLPADPRYRRCFSAPEGRVLVKADYSQIELRIAAKVTGDKAMLDAYASGQDLHTLTARRMTGKAEVTKAERSMAKPVNFGLIYGLSAGSLMRKAKAEYGLDLSEQDAVRYRQAFFDTYAGVRRWHSRLKADTSDHVRTLAGRRVLLGDDSWYGKRANYIVQGTGGDGIKRALALLWERRSNCPGAFPVLAIHDELVVECAADQAEAAKAWLENAMLDGMASLIAPVPVAVEVTVARTWGGAT